MSVRRVLILGGTAWLGGEVARAAVAAGDEVVCLARGESGAVPDGAWLVVADRAAPGAYDELLDGGDWDEIVEVSYQPDFVTSALDALGDHARHWTLVSSISVYARGDEPGADETAELVEPNDLTQYADLKVAAERVTAERVGDRLLTARAGLIAGPGDPTDRFGYWPARLRRGGRVVVPTGAGRHVQVIDVRDLAAWILGASRRGLTGTFTATGNPVPLDDFVAEASRVAGFDRRLETIDDDALLARGVGYWAGPRSLPLWLPATETGFAQRSNAAFRDAGGALRPIAETLADVLADETRRGLERPRRAGLTVADEMEILAAQP